MSLVSQPCSSNFTDFKATKFISVDFRVPSRIASQYPAIALPVIQSRLILLDPILFIVGSCDFVSKYVERLKTVYMTVGNFSRASDASLSRMFPIPSNEGQPCPDVRRAVGTCGPVVDPLARAYGFLISWFVNWNWGEVFLVTDHLIHPQILSKYGTDKLMSSNNIYLVKTFANHLTQLINARP